MCHWNLCFNALLEVNMQSPINNNLLSNVISKWKIKTNKFTKYSIFDNKYDYQNQLILREYRVIYSPHQHKKKFI